MTPQLRCPLCHIVAAGALGDPCHASGCAGGLASPLVLDKLIARLRARQKTEVEILRITSRLGQPLLDGKIVLVDLLGQGGMGAVYLGQEQLAGTQRKVAVKFILMSVISESDRAEYRARFEREARVMVELRHPSAVKLMGFGQEGDDLFMVQEFIDGETLHDLLKRERRLTFERAVKILAPVLRVLNEAHSLGLVHRDLKPLNLMVQTFGEDLQTKVLDFGISKFLRGQKNGTETRAGLAFGSPAYMAPEQSYGKTAPSSDLYAVGVMLFQLITGSRPFKGEDDVQTIMLHRQGTIPQLPAHLSRLQPLIDRALAKKPAERFSSAMAFYEALQRLKGGGALSSTTPAYPRSAEALLEVELGETSLLSLPDAPGPLTPPDDPYKDEPVMPPARDLSWVWGALFIAALLAGGYLGYSRSTGPSVEAPLDVGVSTPTLEPEDGLADASPALIQDAAPVVDSALAQDAAPVIDSAPLKPKSKPKQRRRKAQPKATPVPVKAPAPPKKKKSWKVD